MKSLIWFERTIPINTEYPQTFPIEAYLNGVSRKLEDAGAYAVEVNSDTLTFRYSMLLIKFFREKKSRTIEGISEGIIVIQREQNRVTLKCKFGLHGQFGLLLFIFIAFNTVGSWSLYHFIFSSIFFSTYYLISIHFTFKGFKELLDTERIVA